MSDIRVPKTPLTQTTTSSPGSIRLTKQVSMPALPVPETGMVSPLSVWNKNRTSCCVSSMAARK
jgi:hypothetical protein